MEELNAILSKLEQCLAKVDQAQGSRVRLPKAELELLQQFERVRDFINPILKDREKLRELFGDCTNISRLKAVLEVVRLSGQNANDQRMSACWGAVESVEKLLKEAKEETEQELQAKLNDAVEREKLALSRRRSSVRILAGNQAHTDRMAIAKRLEAKLGKQDRRDLVPGIIAVQDLEVLRGMEPQKRTALGAWMVWMVHRVHLNDPTLTRVDFANLQMPAPMDDGGRMNSRAMLVAPKLVKAIAANTFVEKLVLPNSNLRGPEAVELGRSLATNQFLCVLDIDSNMLTPTDLEAVAQGVGASRSLQEFRCNNQLLGDAGRTRNAALDALLEAARSNPALVKIGMHITEPYFNDEINRQIMRNNRARRIERAATAGALARDAAQDAAEKAAEEAAELQKELEEEAQDEDGDSGSEGDGDAWGEEWCEDLGSPKAGASPKAGVDAALPARGQEASGAAPRRPPSAEAYTASRVLLQACYKELLSVG